MGRSSGILNSWIRSSCFILLSVFILSSCATTYYSSHINSSFIEEKGETNIGGGISLTSLNAQFSTALTDKFRLAGGINYWGWSARFNTFEIGESGIQGQLMAGHYTQLSDHVFAETYAGFGLSSAGENLFAHGIVQPSIGFGRDKPKFLISLRLNYLNNSILEDPNASLNPSSSGETNVIAGMYYDLALTHRFHRDNRVWFLQYGMSGGDIQQRFGDSSFIPFLNFGLNFRLFSKNF